MSSWRTNTDFSAEPYASPSPATTMTRTAPTYCGSSTTCACFSPGLREKGPRNLTTGGKRGLPAPGVGGGGGIPPPESQQPVQLAAVRAGDFVEQIPGGDTQRLAPV